MALAEFIVSFREFFEIAVLLGVMLAYLQKTGKWEFAQQVWTGAGAAALASVLAALAFQALSGGFEEYEALFEGVTLLLAAAFITWLVLWMFGQGRVQDGIMAGMKRGMDADMKIGIAAFAFIAVFREGIEIVLFFEGIKMVAGSFDILWAVAGAIAAAALAYAVFSQLVRLDLGKFFTVTGIVLVIMAGGLVGQGVHELQEAGVLPDNFGTAYDLSGIIDEKGAVGGLAKGIFGLDANPSVLQLAAQLSYYAAACFAYWKIARQKTKSIK